MDSYQFVTERLGLLTDRPDHLGYCLRAASREAGYPDTAAYIQTLRNNLPTHSTWQRLLHHMAIGETYFFRDAAILQDRILPRIIARRRADSSYAIRIWSAGCATGEEPYTVAILLRKLLPDIARWSINILGTDINLEALNVARRGIYSAWSVRGILPATPDLRLQGNHWIVSEQVRQMVKFEYLNLVDTQVGMIKADLILCRNVLLYIDRNLRPAINARLNAALAEGGELLLDGTDTVRPLIQQHGGDLMPVRPSTPKFTLQKSPTVSYEELVRQAKAAADHADWDEAHRLLDKAESQNRLGLPAYYLRALVFEGQGRTTDAIGTLRRCLYLDRNFALGYFTLGNLLARRGDSGQARQQWMNAAALLEKRFPDEKVPQADGMTVSDILALIQAQIAEPNR
jgi:chemotaxis protein methyltransferase CheR